MLTEDRIEKINLTELPEEQFEPAEEVNSPLPLLEYSGKDRKLVTHPYDLIIRSLQEQVDDGFLILADKFQRRRVWTDDQASRLIESLLIHVPIPICYFAELEDGSYSVVDGQQRLTAIYRYMNNNFPLSSLRIRSDLNQKYFHQLGVAEQRLIKNRSIRCIVVLKESDPDIRFDVFERLNSNSVHLNSQELRNSLYRGTLNDLIRELSEDPDFMRVRGVKEVDKRMQDCELILRFFAFHYQPECYDGYNSRFLDKYLEKGQKFDQETLENHRKIFKRVIQDVDFVFGEEAFRLYHSNKGKWGNAINRGIYDVVMIYFAKIESEQLRDHKDRIVKALKEISPQMAFNECFDQESISNAYNIDTAFEVPQARLDLWYQELRNIGLQVEQIKIGEHAELQ